MSNPQAQPPQKSAGGDSSSAADVPFGFASCSSTGTVKTALDSPDAGSGTRTGSQFEQPQFYTQEEVQQILQLAIARQVYQEDLTRQQLWEIAEELEIDPSCLQSAEQDWLGQKRTNRKRQAFDQYRRNRFRQKTVKYLIVNTFLVSLNIVSAGTLSWSLYILLIWGLGLSLEAWRTFQSQGEAYEKAFQRWQFKYEIKRNWETLWSKLVKAWQTN